MGLQPGSLRLPSSMSFPPSLGGKEMTVPVCKESVPHQWRKEEHTNNFSLSRVFTPSRVTQSLLRMTTVPSSSSLHLHFVSSLLWVSLKYFIQTESRINFPKDFVEEAEEGLASQSHSKQSALLIGRFPSPFRLLCSQGSFLWPGLIAATSASFPHSLSLFCSPYFFLFSLSKVNINSSHCLASFKKLL